MVQYVVRTVGGGGGKKGCDLIERERRRESNLWQHLEPLAAGLEPAGCLRTDICQVEVSRHTHTVPGRGRRKSPSASFLWLQVTVSLFVFFPLTPLGAPFCSKRAERKFHSKAKYEQGKHTVRIHRVLLAWIYRAKLIWLLQLACVFIISLCQHLWIPCNFCGLC